MYQEGDLINDQFLVKQRLNGGMGVVYVASDQVTEKTIVLKTLREDLFDDIEHVDADRKDLQRRFEREARAWINLGFHKHIVPAISFLRGSPPFLILEYVEGVTLKSLIHREPEGLTQSEAARYAHHIAAALKYAHECPMPRGGCGVVHRDIKPPNVMIQKDRTARVMDFGLAGVIGERHTTSSERIMGTLAYMPPEQWRGLRYANEQTDLYSLGVVIYEMLTAKQPFPGQTMPELLYQIHECEPQALRELRPDVDPALEELVNECLKKNPDQRPRSAARVADRLAEITGRLPGGENHFRACASCGYVANREHLICPLCSQAPRPKEAQEDWGCLCGTRISAAYKFCIACGLPRTTNVHCRSCGKSNLSKYRYCCHCGRPLSPSIPIQN